MNFVALIPLLVMLIGTFVLLVLRMGQLEKDREEFAKYCLEWNKIAKASEVTSGTVAEVQQLLLDIDRLDYGLDGWEEVEERRKAARALFDQLCDCKSCTVAVLHARAIGAEKAFQLGLARQGALQAVKVNRGCDSECTCLKCAVRDGLADPKEFERAMTKGRVV